MSTIAVLSSHLRVRAVEVYEHSDNKSQVCRTFNIARTTLDDWIKLNLKQVHFSIKAGCVVNLRVSKI